MADEKVVWATYAEGGGLASERTRIFHNQNSAMCDAEWQARSSGKGVYLLKSISYVDTTSPAPVLWMAIP